MRKILLLAVLLAICHTSWSQTGIGYSGNYVKLKGNVSYYDSSMGIVEKDSIGTIRRILIKDIGGNGAIQTEIQNAINALPSIGGQIILPSGSYTIGSADTAIKVLVTTAVKADINIVGQGMGRYNDTTGATGTILVYSGTGRAFAIGRHPATYPVDYELTNCSFKNFRIISRTGATYGIEGHNVRRTLFEDLFIQGFGTGIYLTTISDFNTFNRVYTRKTRTNAVFLNRECNGNMFLNCDFARIDADADSSDGLRIDFSSVGNTVLSSRFHGFDKVTGASGSYAVYIRGSDNNKIVNNYFEKNNISVKISDRSDASQFVNSNTPDISGNFFTQTPVAGKTILVQTSGATDHFLHDLRITNNIFNQDGSYAYNGDTAIYLFNSRIRNYFFQGNTYIGYNNVSGGDSISTKKVITSGATGTDFDYLSDKIYIDQNKQVNIPSDSGLVVDNGGGGTLTLRSDGVGQTRIKFGQNGEVASQNNRLEVSGFTNGTTAGTNLSRPIAFMTKGSVRMTVDTVAAIVIPSGTPDSSLTVTSGTSMSRARIKQYLDIDSATVSISTKSGRIYARGADGLFYYRGSTLVRIDSLIGGGGGGDTIWARSGGFVYPVNTADPVVIGGATGDSLFTVLGSSHLGGNTLVGGNISISGDLTAVGGLFTGEVTIADTAHFNSGIRVAGVGTFLDSIYGAGSAKFRQIFTDSALVEGGIAILAAAGDSVRVTVSGMTPDGVAFANWADSTVNPFGVPNVTCHSGYIKIVSSFNEVSNIRVVYAYIRKQ